MHGTDFETIDRALARAGADAGAAECHGLLCGMFCRQPGLSLDAWMDGALSELTTEDLSPEAAREPLSSLYEGTVDQLAGPDFAFLPLLPADDVALRRRGESLVAWSESFLYGFGSSADSAPSDLSPDANELLVDLSEITRLDLTEIRSEEGQEADFFELLEYVRVGVVLLWESARGRLASGDDGPAG